MRKHRKESSPTDNEEVAMMHERLLRIPYLVKFKKTINEIDPNKLSPSILLNVLSGIKRGEKDLFVRVHYALSKVPNAELVKHLEQMYSIANKASGKGDDVQLYIANKVSTLRGWIYQTYSPEQILGIIVKFPKGVLHNESRLLLLGHPAGNWDAKMLLIGLEASQKDSPEEYWTTTLLLESNIKHLKSDQLKSFHSGPWSELAHDELSLREDSGRYALLPPGERQTTKEEAELINYFRNGQANLFDHAEELISAES